MPQTAFYRLGVAAILLAAAGCQGIAPSGPQRPDRGLLTPTSPADAVAVNPVPVHQSISSTRSPHPFDAAVPSTSTHRKLAAEWTDDEAKPVRLPEVLPTARTNRAEPNASRFDPLWVRR